jgi:small-conductance mechanosensitive channel
MQQGQSLSSQAVNLATTSATDAQALANTRKTFDNLTAQFQVLTAVTLPLTQEIALLEQTRGTLTTWHTAVNAEYNTVLRSLLLRVGFIAIALLALTVASQTWGRLTVKYVADIRRRRQFLLIRRFVIGFLSGLVLILGFVTQFNSLATFAGFITAGIAVGLQTILLSVAAYFFIVGRYGVRVGDRITVAGVTGEVIEVGLVRFYMTELGGSELQPTGRVAVFANSVLFSTGTPLYKQLPGTEYAWHELILRLNQTADIAHVSKLVTDTVTEVYATYKDTIERQHQSVENWMGTPMKSPVISSRVQLADAGPQLTVLFPVGIRNAAEIDSALATTLMERLNRDEVARAAAAAPPMIAASIK